MSGGVERQILRKMKIHRFDPPIRECCGISLATGQVLYPIAGMFATIHGSLGHSQLENGKESQIEIFAQT